MTGRLISWGWLLLLALPLTAQAEEAQQSDLLLQRIQFTDTARESGSSAIPFSIASPVLHASFHTTSFAPPTPSPAFDATRIHYSLLGQSANVTVEVYDFGMNRVRTVVSAAPRTANTEYDEVWDGRSDEGATVPNGVYFYRVVIGDEEKMWGKILVVQ